MSTRILVIEDDEQVRRFLRAALTGHGYPVSEATTIAEGLAAFAARPPDLVLLDLGLPDGDGLTIVRAVRPQSRVPIIVLSARGQEGDKVAALDAGADDYLTKPFGAGELMARIRVALRHALAADDPDEEAILRVGPFQVDPGRHEVLVDGAEVKLTPIEFKILHALCLQPGRVLTHRQLVRVVWGPTPTDQSHTLRVHVATLRRKVEREPARPRWLVTEVGVGYRVREDLPVTPPG